MKSWNMIVTAAPGPGREYHLLRELNRLGEFHPTEFKDVCIGRVENTDRFLEAVRLAAAEGADWVRDLARAIPVEQTFHFTPETLAAQLKEAVAPLCQRMGDGAFYVRLERRGLVGQVASPEVEREVADHLFSLAENQGKRLRVSFEDADYVVAAETLGNECGVALLGRELRERYPFVQTR
ncbi:MAG: THUMP domain-containing protein [Pseudomonadota bacterium]|jgi:tRNA(Ser,Leu) C12 N-acetylase TAN1